MLAWEEARRRILDGVEALPAQRRGVHGAAGLVAAEDVTAVFPLPPFANSAMDGYAVRHADLADLPVTLPVVVTAAAGSPAGRPIGPGEAARILTGAVMVEGADTVVPVELTDGGPGRVTVNRAPDVGAHVRRPGEDVIAGTTVVAAGTRLKPAHVGLAAAVGRGEVAVHPPPRVAVVSTGDELVPPGPGKLGPGRIYDSNGPMIAAALRHDGVVDVTLVHASDDATELRDRLHTLAPAHDLVLTTGGVSMGGEYDVVKVVLQHAGVDFWEVAMRPAKPMAFGRLADGMGALFAGLPGNPVSSLVSYTVFVVPLLRALAGVDPPVGPPRRAIAAEAMHRPDDGKTHFVRVTTDLDGRVRSAGGQGSHMLAVLAAADALAVVPPERLSVEPDEAVEVMPL